MSQEYPFHDGGFRPQVPTTEGVLKSHFTEEDTTYFVLFNELVYGIQEAEGGGTPLDPYSQVRLEQLRDYLLGGDVENVVGYKVLSNTRRVLRRALGCIDPRDRTQFLPLAMIVDRDSAMQILNRDPRAVGSLDPKVLDVILPLIPDDSPVHKLLKEPDTSEVRAEEFSDAQQTALAICARTMGKHVADKRGSTDRLVLEQLQIIQQYIESIPPSASENISGEELFQIAKDFVGTIANCTVTPESERMPEYFNNPQAFFDDVMRILGQSPAPNKYVSLDILYDAIDKILLPYGTRLQTRPKNAPPRRRSQSYPRM